MHHPNPQATLPQESWFPSLGRGSGDPRTKRTELGPQSPLTSLPPRAAFSRPNQRAGSRTRPGAGPPGGDGPQAAGVGRRARSPAAALIVTRPQLNRVRRSRGAAEPRPSATWVLARGGAAAGKPSRRPRSSGQQPAAGEGQPPPALSRRPRPAEARPQLGISCWKRRRRRGRSLGRGWGGQRREGTIRKPRTPPSVCTPRSVCHGWLKNHPDPSAGGGSGGGSAAAAREAEGGAAARAAAAVPG